MFRREQRSIKCIISAINYNKDRPIELNGECSKWSHVAVTTT